jgi:hypothetical protein
MVGLTTVIMDNEEATHLLIILFFIVIAGMTMLWCWRDSEEFSLFRGVAKSAKPTNYKNALNPLTKVKKPGKITRNWEDGMDWSGRGLPNDLRAANALTPPSFFSRLSGGISKGAKSVGQSMKNNPWDVINVLTTIPFVAMMFMPAGGGGEEEGGGSGGPGSAGSMASVSVVMSGCFFCCMCICMMMMMMSSNSS